MREIIRRYHLRFKKNGAYQLAWHSLVRLLIIAVILTGVFLLLQHTINDFTETVKVFIFKWRPRFVLVLFFLSESLLGLIPPDFFIAWSHQFQHDLWMLTALAVLSYLGGIVSYYIGYWIGESPKVYNYYKRKFGSHMHKIYQLGGIIIVFAAILPLPFSMACMAAGSVKYSFKKVLILGLFRFVRFYGYAVLVFNLI